MQPMTFDGKVAIVTGAGGNPGLGRSYALLLASRGAKVVVNDLGVGPDGRGAIGKGPQAVVDEIRDAGGEAIVNTDSVATPVGARAVVDSAVQTWGRVDILINNAGIAPFALFDEIADDDIQRVVGVHLFGHIWMCRAAWPHMKRNGYGRLVNISSNVALLGLPYQSTYAAAKLGVVGLTRVLAAEGSPYGIRANVLMPVADTLAWQTMLDPEFSQRARADGATPEAVAPVAVWLAHESCPYSGKIFQAKGGTVREAFFATTNGIARDGQTLTPEAVADAAPAITNRSGAVDQPDPKVDLLPSMTPKQYQTTPDHSRTGSAPQPAHLGE